MNTIREAIKFYTERKCVVLKREYLDIVFTTSLCVIIPLKNGVRIFIDTHPEMEYLKEECPLEMPNKNGIFKRVSFEILDGVEPVITSLNINKSSCNGVLYYVDAAKERAINEDKFTEEILYLYK